MRLTAHEVSEIKAAAKTTFGSRAIVRLFGSRVDDSNTGGDIDLHVELPTGDTARSKEISFRIELLKHLDEEQIDFIVREHDQTQRWIDRVAYRDGVIL
jgi:predicted nucleotidyltransferase